MVFKSYLLFFTFIIVIFLSNSIYAHVEDGSDESVKISASNVHPRLNEPVTLTTTFYNKNNVTWENTKSLFLIYKDQGIEIIQGDSAWTGKMSPGESITRSITIKCTQKNIYDIDTYFTTDEYLKGEYARITLYVEGAERRSNIIESLLYFKKKILLQIEKADSTSEIQTIIPSLFEYNLSARNGGPEIVTQQKKEFERVRKEIQHAIDSAMAKKFPKGHSGIINNQKNGSGVTSPPLITTLTGKYSNEFWENDKNYTVSDSYLNRSFIVLETELSKMTYWQ
jgi:hypothetical protein